MRVASPPAGRQRPDASLQIDGERATVGRDAHRHGRALAHGDREGRWLWWRSLCCAEHGDRTEDCDQRSRPAHVVPFVADDTAEGISIPVLR